MFEVKHMGRDLRAVFDVHYCNYGLFHTKTHIPRGVFITRSPPFSSPLGPLSHSQIIVRCFRVGCGEFLSPLLPLMNSMR